MTVILTALAAGVVIGWALARFIEWIDPLHEMSAPEPQPWHYDPLAR